MLEWFGVVFSFFAALAALFVLWERAAATFSKRARLERRASRAGIPSSLLDEPTESLHWITDRDPSGWQYLFFSDVLERELKLVQDLRRDIRYGPSKRARRLGTKMAADFIEGRAAELEALFPRLDRLFEEGVRRFFVENEDDLDLLEVRGVAQRLAQVAREALMWRLEFSAVVAPDGWQQDFAVVASAGVKLADRIERLGDAIWQEVKVADHDPPEDGEHIEVVLELKLGELLPCNLEEIVSSLRSAH